MGYPARGHADNLDLGNWNTVCFFCGHKYKASELLKHWQGFWVCETCYEPRQPQDFVRAIPDTEQPPWTQPRPAWSFIAFCDLDSVQPIVDVGTVDCMIIGAPSTSSSNTSIAGLAIAGLMISGAP